MEAKEQTFEVVLYTTDEEVDGENFIDEAIEREKTRRKAKHIQSISVNAIRNEWDTED